MSAVEGPLARLAATSPTLFNAARAFLWGLRQAARRPVGAGVLLLALFGLAYVALRTGTAWAWVALALLVALCVSAAIAGYARARAESAQAARQAEIERLAAALAAAETKLANAAAQTADQFAAARDEAAALRMALNLLEERLAKFEAEADRGERAR